MSAKILVTREQHLIYFKKDEEKESRVRYNLKEKSMQKKYIWHYKRKSPEERWQNVGQQYDYFRNCSFENLEFDEKDAKFKKLILDSKQMNNSCTSLSSFISRLDNVLVYENFINEEVKYNVDYSYRSSYSRTYRHFKHGLEEYDKNVISFFKKTGFVVNNTFERKYFESKEFYISAIQIIGTIDVSPEKQQKILEEIIYNSDSFNMLIVEFKYDIKALFNYIINYLERFENIKMNEALRLLKDYYSMASRIGRDVKKYPKYLKSMHDIIMSNYEAYKKEYNEDLFRKLMKKELEHKGKEFIVINPTGPKDIISEGTSLNHCVSSYVDSILERKTYIFFLRKKEEPEKSLVTLELKEGRITQAKGSYNRPITKEEKEFLESYVKKKQLVLSEAL